MIKKIKIENFRSICYLELKPQKLNAFIGANSSGKSNILRALNLIIGSTYATIKSFDDNDFFEKDRKNHIIIEATFDNSLTCNNQVYGFRLQNNGSEVNYIALNQNGQPVTYYNGREVKVTSEMKDEVSLMYLTLDRLSSQQIRPSQWTIYGKLLKHISELITKKNKEDLINDINNTYNTNINPFVNPAENLLKGFVTEQTGKTLDLRLSLIDPSMILKDLRPRITDENGFEVDIDEEGSGVQSSVAIAIARTYAKIVNLPLILAIEEPELYLHPHACRHFYKILNDLANSGIQVFYSTHERSFVNIVDYQFINLVTKSSGETSVSSFSGNISDFDEIKAASKFDDELNEVFFASKVILVEGPADKIALKTALEKLGVDLDKHNISIVDCGSISGIKPMAEILKNYNIECIALVDEDPGNSTTAAHLKGIQTVVNSQNIYIQRPSLEGLFSISGKFSKEKALKDIPSYYSTNNIQQVYIDLKTGLKI